MTYVSHGIGPCAVEYAAANSPYEVAVRKVEIVTKQPRSEWEWRIGHPYNVAVLKCAAHLVRVSR